ncbi:hypothetical protein BJ875DRAFT_439855 [Amylocarpus encephaloides]|uniref:Uncharacterized protein n=1 Tax=Amylocarpus encephaloides TaxID=45428 RepID=A0A9P7YLN2_9HELO|nr:hypothetical protein BJ875DRAFT_439855 [Amylocarpus encephaloides]
MLYTTSKSVNALLPQKPRGQEGQSVKLECVRSATLFPTIRFKNDDKHHDGTAKNTIRDTHAARIPWSRPAETSYGSSLPVEVTEKFSLTGRQMNELGLSRLRLWRANVKRQRAFEERRRAGLGRFEGAFNVEASPTCRKSSSKITRSRPDRPGKTAGGGGDWISMPMSFTQVSATYLHATIDGITASKALCLPVGFIRGNGFCLVAMNCENANSSRLRCRVSLMARAKTPSLCAVNSWVLNRGSLSISAKRDRKPETCWSREESLR